ncbi:YadA-like family protein [Sneathia sanguinegens]|uniref:YadA-like family protein n=1 Tax=Sneathia sanguinegens TaxID=40543 RepID=UPI00258831C9|nr:YadA-like family protein [Sneathia sanguinegens]MDU4652055.1 YadA-like family protein [Sneathia sanguinegens]
MKRKIFLILALIIGIISFSEENSTDVGSYEITKDEKGNYIIVPKNGASIKGDIKRIEQKIEKGNNNIIYGRVNLIKEGDDKNFSSSGESDNNFLKGDGNVISMSNRLNIFGDSNKVYGMDDTNIFGEHNTIRVDNKENEEKVYQKLTKNNVLAYGNYNGIYNSRNSYTFGNNNEIYRSFNSLAIGEQNVIKRTYTEKDEYIPQDTPESEYSFAYGFLNQLIDSQYSEAFGEENEINNSDFSSAKGLRNKIETSYGSTINGLFSNIKKSKNSFIQGYASNIENAPNSSIIGGYFSKVNMKNSVAIGSFSATKKIEKNGYLTNQSKENVYALAVGGEYVYKDDNKNETVYKAKRRIQGLADGAEDDEAVTVAQLKKVDEKIKGVSEAKCKSELALSGISNAVAIANLVQVNSYSNYRHNLSVAYGYYGESHAIALGFSGVTKNRKFVYKLSGSVNNKGNLALGLGAGLMLGDREDSLDTNNLDVKKLYDKIDKLEKENEEFKEYKKNTENKIKELEKQLRILINKK